MAATQRRSKKTHVQRGQKTRQMGLQKPQPRRKRAPPQPGRWKPVLRKSRGKRRLPTLYISEMMRRLLRGDRRMSAQAKGLVSASLCRLYSAVFTEANHRRKRRRGSFIGTAEVQAALETVMKGKAARESSATALHSRSR